MPQWKDLPAHLQEAALDELKTVYTEDELEAFAAKSLDELYGDVSVAGMRWNASAVLKEMDPIAYREFVNNHSDAFCQDEGFIEVSTKGPRPLTFYVNEDELEQAIDDVISLEDIEDTNDEEE